MKNLQALTIPSDKALDVFIKKGGLDPILQKIQDEVNLFNADTTTKKGRDEIASMAHNVAKSKSYLDSVGKNLVAELKRQPKLVDESRKSMRDFLDNLKREVREPLTKIEVRESNITNNINALIDDLEQLNVEDLSARLETLLNISLADVVISTKEITLLLSTAVAKVEQIIVSKRAEQEKLAAERRVEAEKLEIEKQAIAAERAQLEQEKSRLDELELQRKRMEQEKADQARRAKEELELAKIRAENDKQKLIQIEKQKQLKLEQEKQAAVERVKQLEQQELKRLEQQKLKEQKLQDEILEAAKNKKENLVKHSKILLQRCLDSGLELNIAKQTCSFIRAERNIISEFYNCY
tara:strand:+ start:1342 stop:2400 length:1059 start_codon:yes stop_codon:yes gene_type:complete